MNTDNDLRNTGNSNVGQSPNQQSLSGGLADLSRNIKDLQNYPHTATMPFEYRGKLDAIAALAADLSKRHVLADPRNLNAASGPVPNVRGPNDPLAPYPGSQVSYDTYHSEVRAMIGNIKQLHETIQRLQNTNGAVSQEDQSIIDDLQAQVQVMEKRWAPSTGNNQSAN